MHGGVLEGTQGAKLATSWRRRVRNNRVDGSTRADSRGGDQTGLLLLLLWRWWCWGGVICLRPIVAARRGIRWMLLQWLLVVVGI